MGHGSQFVLRLCGPFHLSGPGGRHVNLALIALLATAPDGARTRRWVQDRLWGSRAEVQAQASLRRELSNLRSALGDQQTTAAELVRADHEWVRLDRALVTIDIEADTNGQDLEFLEGLDIGDEEGFEDWLREQRAYFEARRRDRPLPPDTRSALAVSAQIKPTVGVRRFVERADDGETLVAAAMTDQIAMRLARCATLSVRAPAPAAQASVAFAEAPVSTRYILEGAVDRARGALRVAVALVDMRVSAHIMAETFEGEMASRFAFEDRVASAVAPIVEAAIDIAERRHALSSKSRPSDAYHLFWLGNARFREWTETAMIEAIDYLDEAIALQPENSWATAIAAFCHACAHAQNWGMAQDRHLEAAMLGYDRALRLAGDDPLVLGYAAGVQLAIGGDMTAAEKLMDRAIALQPGSAQVLFWAAWIDIALGSADRAIARFEEAMVLSPRSPGRPYNLMGTGLGHLSRGRLVDAHRYLGEAVQHLPEHPLVLAALCVCNVFMTKMADAAHYAARLDRTGGLDKVLPILRSPEQRAMLVAGYEAACKASA
jgi:TolB-like protein